MGESQGLVRTFGALAEQIGRRELWVFTRLALPFLKMGCPQHGRPLGSVSERKERHQFQAF